METDDLDDDQAMALEDEEGELYKERNTLLDGTPIWPDEIKNVAGVLLTIEDGGSISFIRGRLKPGQSLDTKSGTIKGKPTADKSGKPAKPKKPQLSNDMLERLDLHRAAACRQLLVEKPALAVQLLTTQLVVQLFFTHDSTFAIRAENSDAKLRYHRYTDVAKADARKVLADSIKGIITPTKAGDVLPWIQKLTSDQLQQVQALCAAVSLDNLRGRSLGAAALALALDMADWWQPDAAHYLGNVPKALMLEAVTEAKGKPATAALASHKKDALIAEAAKQLAGTGWLPKPLRGSGYAVGAKPAAKAKPAKKKPAAKKRPAKKEAKARSWSNSLGKTSSSPRTSPNTTRCLRCVSAMPRLRSSAAGS